ncbi:MAG: flagellar biosynthesis protein FlhB [Armatimonadota bacterium]
MALEDRTEAATPKRREDARKKGMVARSPELGPAIVLMAGLLSLRIFGPRLVEGLRAVARFCIGSAASVPGTDAMWPVLSQSAVHIAVSAAPVLLCLVAASVLIGMAQSGVQFTLAPISPDWSRVNPLKGIARLMSLHALIDLVRSLLKVAILAAICWSFARSAWVLVLSLSQFGLPVGLSKSAGLLNTLLLRTGAALAVLAVLDYGAQRWQFERSLRMTKQEVREEMRQLEGDPVIRSYVRRRHREMGTRRMMQAVPQATAVVTNPTHVAVALRYESGKMPAPVVVAKGARLLAERIKEVARQHNVPIVENPPLARALYKSVNVGDFIPPELYRAVAEILAFVYRLNSGARRSTTAVTGGTRG